jgi:formate/nitrite transporter FocA (FNT family)
MTYSIFLKPKFIIFIIILYPLLFIWQGLDFADAGYSMTVYQQVFNEPESISYNFVTWLTNIIGGFWFFSLVIHWDY